MWGANSNSCEIGCQCSGLITDNFRINSGNSSTKRKQEEAKTINYRSKMNPHSLDLNRKQSPLNSPISTPKRRVLGEIQNSPLFIPNTSPTIGRLRGTTDKSPIIKDTLSPLTSRSNKMKRSKLSRVYEERSKFKLDKENRKMEFLDVIEETRDCSFGGNSSNLAQWSQAKLDFSDALPPKPILEKEADDLDIYVPDKEVALDQEFETLHDLEEEFDSDNFDTCTKYEIISTDSPDIISSGRTTSRKINSKNFNFGAPLSDTEQSTSFNRPMTSVTRMLTFEESFEFTSPAKRAPYNVSVKKSLKFTDTSPKISSETQSSSSITPTKLETFPSESTTSVESGFVSEFEEPFLEIDSVTDSPKIDSLKDLMSADITDYGYTKKLQRCVSYNPGTSRAKVALFSIIESPTKKSNKRTDRTDEGNMLIKRKKSNCESPKADRRRPTHTSAVPRAFSENHASIMSALARSAVDPDLIGDFTLPFALPLTIGNHSDLKSISCETLASLLRGEFTDSINEFQVIDCRYPYEYEGGHILGAVNLYTRAQILTLVNEPVQPKDGDKRNILVFHCEFSLERGPKLSRFLRSSDRAKNKENYPSLCYPEVYLLHEGYRAFYQRFPDLCSPTGYTAMLDPQHKHLLQKHRSAQELSSSHSTRRNRFLL